MEQGLPPWGICNLGHINLSRFVYKVGEPWDYEVDWGSLAKAVRLGVRFQDNLIDLSPYFHDENRELQKKERRIGMGTLGVAEMLIRLKLRYGSKESIDFLDELYSKIAFWAYDESVNLAIEKGAFELLDAEKYLQSGFMKRMITRFPSLEERILKHGIRNVCILTQAPTGTTGTMHATSTGIEPFYSYEWWRNSRLGRVREEIQVLKEWLMAHKLDGLSLDEVNLPDYFTNAMELTPYQHVDVQAVIQKWTDSSISKTTNAPNNYTIDQTRELYEYAYKAGLKGVTIYRDGSRTEQVLELDKKEDSPTEPTESLNESDQEEGYSDVDDEYILIYRDRPSRVFGCTEKLKTPIGKLYLTVNFGNDGRPIEVFIKMGKAGQETNAFTEAIGRLISTMLKFGIPYDQIIKQLRGIVGSNPFYHKADFDSKAELIKSIPDAVGMVLERYKDLIVPDGNLGLFVEPSQPIEVKRSDIKLEIANPFESNQCPECGGSVIRAEGCEKCSECSWSKC